MFLKNEKYKISMEYFPYDPDSADNYPFDKIIKLEKSKNVKNVRLHIEKQSPDKENTSKDILFIAPYNTYLTNYQTVLLEDDFLVILFDYAVVKIDLYNNRIVNQVWLESAFGTILGTMFEIYRYSENYIVYGECCIYMLDSNLKEKWHFSGMDIFVRCNDGDEPAFQMKEDKICLYDFMDNYYEIDYEGKIIFQKLSS